MQFIDLRSDTVTHPTPEMREAMFKAEVGDDVFGDDPTVNRLEELVAEITGKEASLFVASGTMGNLVALLTHCGRGDEAIVGDQSHTLVYEQGGMAALGGITPRAIPNQPDGTLRLEDIESAVRGDNVHFPRSRLVCLENTHNLCHGTPLTVEYTESVAELAHSQGLRLHLDGARVFNAAAALGVDVQDLLRPVDSVTFCLSKGLCAPVGSMVCGSLEFITQARRARKVLGGGMRQAGVLAAAGIVALEQVAPRLHEDHARAAKLAQGLALIPGVGVGPVHTNIVYFWLTEEKDSKQVAAELVERGVLMLDRGNGRFRAVTHYWISDQDITDTLETIRGVLA